VSFAPHVVTQAPAVQVVPAAHVVPQVPQFESSVCVFAQ
jgi:hypothetical protein